LLTLYVLRINLCDLSGVFVIISPQGTPRFRKIRQGIVTVRMLMAIFLFSLPFLADETTKQLHAISGEQKSTLLGHKTSEIFVKQSFWLPVKFYLGRYCF